MSRHITNHPLRRQSTCNVANCQGLDAQTFLLKTKARDLRASTLHTTASEVVCPNSPPHPSLPHLSSLHSCAARRCTGVSRTERSRASRPTSCCRGVPVLIHTTALSHPSPLARSAEMSATTMSGSEAVKANNASGTGAAKAPTKTTSNGKALEGARKLAASPTEGQKG